MQTKVEENSKITDFPCCVACLKDENQVTLESVFDEGLKETYNTLINDEISQLDSLPLAICNKCKENLLLISSFQQQCRNSFDSLRAKLIISPEIVIIKEEIVDRAYENEQESSSEAKISTKLEKNIQKVRNTCKNARNPGDKRYYCPQCEASYVKPIELRRHILKMHQGGLKCKYCRHVFLDKTEFEHHLKEEETKIRPEIMFCCHECGYTSKWKAGLRKHITLYHTPDQPKLICDICGKSYVLRAQFKQHFIANHMEKQYQCMKCGKTFSFKIDLEHHIKGQHSVEGIAEGPEALVNCKFCDKSMKARSMRYHVRNVHLDIRTHNCSICYKSFKTKNVLSRHLASHKKREEELKKSKKESKLRTKIINTSIKKINKCIECNLIFNMKVDLTQHHLNTHLDKETLERDYVGCKFCPLKIKRNSIQMHVKLVHINAKQFKCDECGFAFNRHINLRKHQMIHQGKRPYNCNICSSGHWQTEQLRKHFEKAHNLNYTLEDVRNICGKVKF